MDIVHCFMLDPYVLTYAARVLISNNSNTCSDFCVSNNLSDDIVSKSVYTHVPG